MFFQRTHPVNLDSLYGPSSPPGLLHAEELVRGQQNIWGSPARESSMPKQEEGIKNLLHALKTPKPSGQQFTDPSIVVAGKLSAALPNAKTLDEIEQQMTPRGPPPPPQGGVPQAMTVEELERQMRGGPGGHHHMRRSPPPMPQPGMPLPIGTPPHGVPFMQQSLPQVSVSCRCKSKYTCMHFICLVLYERSCFVSCRGYPLLPI